MTEAKELGLSDARIHPAEALHRMSLSDNLRRLARERIPTAPAKWLGPPNRAPRTQPKFAAALLFETQTWCTNDEPFDEA